MLPFSVILWRLRSHHFIMAEVRNFKTLVQNEGLDPIGEIQTGMRTANLMLLGLAHQSAVRALHWSQFTILLSRLFGAWVGMVHVCS